MGQFRVLPDQENVGNWFISSHTVV